MMRCIRSTVACSCAAFFIIVCVFVRHADVLFDREDLTRFIQSSPTFNITQKWMFNKPLEMKIRGSKDRKAVAHQNEERQISSERLSNMTQVLYYNSDELPTTSAFGTKTGSNICEGSDENQCIPKFKYFETRIRYSPKYKIVSCIMQKSMSTILQAIMCYLYDENAFKKAGRVLSRESYESRFCKGKNEMNVIKGNQLWRNKAKINAKWLHLAVVRDPIDRFLSGFVDKCLRKPKTENFCNGCRTNMTCFLITEYARIQDQMNRIKFELSFEDRHFFPQNWRCDFKWHLENYNLLHYRSSLNATEDFVHQLLPLLKGKKIPASSLTFIEDQLKSGRTVHSTFASEARMFFENRLLNSPFLLEHVVRIFYSDFKLFGYEVPTINFN